MIGVRYEWVRLAAALLIMTVGCSGQYAMSVALLPVQSEFLASRSDASLPYTVAMISFGIGGIFMGRLFDRFGAIVPTLAGAILVGTGYVAAGLSQTLWQFCIAYGVLLGLGGSAMFAPLIADTAIWFERNRGLAVAICASGNYLAGVLWPPALQLFFDLYGWRSSFIGVGALSAVSIGALSLVLRRRACLTASMAAAPGSTHALGLSPRALLVLLCLAGVACCVAMAMPQVHLVAYCGELGFSAASGARMTSLMFLAGIVSRLASGWICDRIGGLRTLLLGSCLQGVALLLFLPFDGLGALYIVSAMFGLFQGGIVPSYAIIVREHFPVRVAGASTAIVLTFTLAGMAFGGWLPGLIFDVTGSYKAAFGHAILWNLLNLAIVGWLVRRLVVSRALAPA